MNLISQLKCFYTFPDLRENSSQRLQIKWRVNNPAKANVLKVIKISEPKTDATITRNLYQGLKDAQPKNIFIQNWIAFLSRYGEKTAREVKYLLLKSGLISGSESAEILKELILISLFFCSQPVAFFSRFNCQEKVDELWYKILHGYCHKKAKGKLIDELRSQKGTKTLMRSNLGLVAITQETKVIDSLMFKGITKQSELDLYLVIRQCFMEVKQAYKIKTQSPKSEDFKLIAHRFNQLLEQGKLEQNILVTKISDEEIKKYLEEIGQAIRYYIDRPIVSLDVSVSEENNLKFLDLITDDSSIDNNDFNAVETSLTVDKYTLLMKTYLEELTGREWLILFFRELVDLKQTVIANMLNVTQKTISKNYRGAWKKLLTKVITELIKMPSSEYSPEIIDDLQEGLSVVIKNYFSDLFHQYLLTFTEQKSTCSESQRPSLEQIPSAKDLFSIFLSERLNNQLLNINSEIEQQLELFLAHFI